MHSFSLNPCNDPLKKALLLPFYRDWGLAESGTGLKPASVGSTPGTGIQGGVLSARQWMETVRHD